MEGFKKIVKMKTGGSVSKAVAKCCAGGKMKKGGEVDAADIKQDKAIVKKAFSMHDKQEHKGEKTDLSKLKKGGRAKKEVGTVKKFKKGGEVTNVYDSKKSAGDKDNIAKVKAITPTKAAAPSKASVKAKSTGAKTSAPSGDLDPIEKVPSFIKTSTPAFKCGGKIKKYSEGKMVKQAGATEAQNKYYQANMDKADKKAAEKDYEVFGSRGDAARKGMAEGRMDALGNAYKKGGKIKKYSDGGYTGDDPIVKYRMGMTDTPAAAPAAAAPAPREDMIEDESGRGVVTPEQAAYSKSAPGSEPATPRAVASTVRRRRPAPAAAAKPGLIDRIKNWASSSNKYTSVPSGNAMKKGGKACK